MSWTITEVLVILWVLGLVSSYTMGGFIHKQADGYELHLQLELRRLK